jgi:type VI secretion system protein ImpK
MHMPQVRDTLSSRAITSYGFQFPYLLTFFHEFYIEVTKMKLAALTHTTQGMKRAGANTAHFLEIERNPNAEAILDRLFYFLEEQAVDAKRVEGTFGESLYREAQYIMAALADEIFISMPAWSGSSFWECNLLEERLFHSHVAGDRFFENIDKFLELKEPSRKDLGFLYLTALGLGFRGRYRGFDDDGKIEHYKKELFVHLYQEKPSLFNTRVMIFPKTLQFNISQILEESSVQKSKQRWRFILGGIVASYILLSYVIWYDTTSALRRTVDMILEDVSFISDHS